MSITDIIQAITAAATERGFELGQQSTAMTGSHYMSLTIRSNRRYATMSVRISNHPAPVSRQLDNIQIDTTTDDIEGRIKYIAEVMDRAKESITA